MPKTMCYRPILILLVGIINWACYNKFNDPKPFETEDITTNITTAELSKLVAADGYLDVEKDLRVRGYVTAHDKDGNFYKSFIIEDGGVGVEILEGLNDSYVRHELGYEIILQINGLRLSRSRGIIQVGLPAAEGSYYPIEYLGHEYIADKHITNSGKRKIVEPQEFTLSDLANNPQLASSLCGSLVRITGLRYFSTSDEDQNILGGTKCFISTNDPLIDGKPQCEIFSYVSRYSNFSQVEIPLDSGSITGILQGGTVSSSDNWSMMIKPRRRADFDFK